MGWKIQRKASWQNRFASFFFVVFDNFFTAIFFLPILYLPHCSAFSTSSCFATENLWAFFVIRRDFFIHFSFFCFCVPVIIITFFSTLLLMFFIFIYTIFFLFVASLVSLLNQDLIFRSKKWNKKECKFIFMFLCCFFAIALHITIHEMNCFWVIMRKRMNEKESSRVLYQTKFSFLF